MSAAVRTLGVRVLATSVCLRLGLTGRLEASGRSASTGGLTIGRSFRGLSAWLYSRRQLTTATVAGVLLAGKLVMHIALVLGTSPDAMAVGHPVKPHASSVPISLACGGLMILAHLVANVLAAGVIVTAEAVWFGVVALARWIARVVRVVLHVPYFQPWARVTVGVSVALWTSRAVGASPGRGPPCLHLSW